MAGRTGSWRSWVPLGQGQGCSERGRGRGGSSQAPAVGTSAVDPRMNVDRPQIGFPTPRMENTCLNLCVLSISLGKFIVSTIKE